MSKSTSSLSRTFRRFPELVLAGASVAALVTGAGCAAGLPSMNAELTDADVADLLSGTVFEDGAQFDDALYIIPTEPMHHGHDHGDEVDAGADADADADAGSDADADADAGSDADVDEDTDGQEADDQETEEKPEEEAGDEGDEPETDPVTDEGSDDPVAEAQWQVVSYGDAEADFELFADIQIAMDGAAAWYGWVDMGYGPVTLEMQGMSRSIDEDANQVSVRGSAGQTAVTAEDIGISRECGYIQGGTLQLSGNGTVVEMAFSAECDSCFTMTVDGIDQGKACID